MTPRVSRILKVHKLSKALTLPILDFDLFCRHLLIKYGILGLSGVMKMAKPDTKADTKRNVSNASYASDAVYKPTNSGISRWC